MSFVSIIAAPAAPTPASSPDEIIPLLIGATVGEVERELVLHTLARCDGNRTRAARVLGISVRICATRSGNIQPAGSTFPRTATSPAA
jgi:DNA-binding NtrC family response regulator